MAKGKNKKKKLKLRGLLVILLFIYLVVMVLFYLWKTPIKNIQIVGNYYLKDNYLIKYLELEDTSIFKVSKRKIKKKLDALDLVSDVKISKNYLGKLKITIKEDRILFYNWNNKKIILTDGREIDYNSNYLGVPVLINYVPDTIYTEFVKKIEKINRDVLSLVSEIEYSPSSVGDKIIDEQRFLFRMNDGNKVYINTVNIEKFNEYLEIYEIISNKNGDVDGCLYLDSNSNNNHFNKCEEEVVENNEDIDKQDEE